MDLRRRSYSGSDGKPRVSRGIGMDYWTEKTVVSGVVMMGVKGSKLPTLT